MKIKIFIIITVLICVFKFGHAIQAQERTEQDTVTIPQQTQTESLPAEANTSSQPSSPTTASAKKTVSTLSCVKVGNPSEDLKASVCKSTAPVVGGPLGPRPEAPDPGNDIQQAIQNQFGITMDGYDDAHLEWAWEKFWEVSNTNFNSLVRGAVIRPTSISNTQQVGCPPNLSVLLGPYGEETGFKHILIHELGHVIRNCAGRERAQETAFQNAFITEGGVSYYGRNAESCTGSDSRSEDYAEMIAFYLNPGTSVASYLKCYQSSQNRYTEQDFPLHYDVARNVLGAF